MSLQPRLPFLCGRRHSLRRTYSAHYNHIPCSWLPRQLLRPLTPSLQNSALPDFTIVQRTDHSIKSSTTRLPTTNRVVKAYRTRRLVSVRKHPRGHGKKKNTPYCRSLPSSPPVVLQYACAPPPTNPWESHGLPPCSFSGFCNEEIGSDDSATSSVQRGTFWASESDEATSSTPSRQQHHSPYAFHTSVTTVHKDLDWLEEDDFFDTTRFATQAICHSVSEYYRASATFLGFQVASLSASFTPVIFQARVVFTQGTLDLPVPVLLAMCAPGVLIGQAQTCALSALTVPEQF